MGRRKKERIPAFPSSPVRLVDAMLSAEADIRRAVDDEIKALSLIGQSNHGESVAVKWRGYADRTGGAAVSLADGLPCVVLEDGRTVKHPQKWLAVFGAVRKKARECERPQLILDEWAGSYSGKIVFTEYVEDLRAVQNIKNWIRYSVLMTAAAAGLVDFSEAEIMVDIETENEDETDYPPI